MIHIWVLIITVYSTATNGGAGLTSQEFYKESECLAMVDTLLTIEEPAGRLGYGAQLSGTCHKKTVFLDNDRLYQVCNASDSVDYFEGVDDWHNQCQYIIR